MAAVLDAAARLFGDRGPRAVTIRDIAAAAKVNHALVHRYFGSKQQVLRMVLEKSAAATAAAIESSRNSSAAIAKAFQALLGNDSYWRALARAMLDGEEPRRLQRNFPTIRRLIALLRQERDNSHTLAQMSAPPRSTTAEAAVAIACALMMGWLLFEPLLLAAAELNLQDRRGIRDAVNDMLKAIIEGRPSANRTNTRFDARAARRKPPRDGLGGAQCNARSSEEAVTAAAQNSK
jgi:AcrR family transcriptional regulator